MKRRGIVGKWWGVVFAAVMLACLGIFLVAPFVTDSAGNRIWWLPPQMSSHAYDVDFLFYVILFITGFFFVLTEAILVVFMFKYAGQPGPAKAAPAPTGPNIFQKMFPFITNQHRLEMAWTIVPAGILLYIAFAQVPAWLRIKDRSRTPTMGGDKTPIQVEVSARQFEWRVRYPSSTRLEKWLKNEDTDDFKSFGAFHNALPRYGQQDDTWLPNELHLWKGQTILIHLNTLDVIHSFNVPFMRVKQDALPGKTIPVWFTPIQANTKLDPKSGRWEDRYNPKTKKHGDKGYRWEIACAELCGWGHHRMIGRVYVHENKKDFFDWLKKEEEKNRPPMK
jgi:cytochrome c oxidase subunit 2